MKRFGPAITILMFFLAAMPSMASSILTYSFQSGGLGASASFQQDGSNLQVTLTNTGTGDTVFETQILTGLFFRISGDPNLSRISAMLGEGSSVQYDPDGQPELGNVGGEWAYKSGLTTAPNGANQGISSSGLGIFGPGDRFSGENLAGPESPNGAQYGILSYGDDFSTGKKNVLDSGGMIYNSVVFSLTGLPESFVLSKGTVTNVSFQYGTSLLDPNYSVQNPEPGSLILLGSGIAGIGLIALRRRKK